MTPQFAPAPITTAKTGMSWADLRRRVCGTCANTCRWPDCDEVVKAGSGKPPGWWCPDYQRAQMTQGSLF
jgi:hypothetical protein